MSDSDFQAEVGNVGPVNSNKSISLRDAARAVVEEHEALLGETNKRTQSAGPTVPANGLDF